MGDDEMEAALELPTDGHGLVLARSARALGRQAELYAAVERGELVRVRRGAYRAPAADEASVSAPERLALAYRMRVLAAASTLRNPVFTGHSAIALHGLPIIGPWPAEVFVIARRTTGSHRPGIRYVSSEAAPELTEVDGCRTVAVHHALHDLARRAPLAAALTATDAALHRPRDAEAGSPLTTIERLRERHLQREPYRGSRRVAAVLARASSQSESPLETLSRLVIEELGFPAPELQHRLELTELGRNAYLDYWWPAYGIAAEADGAGKYRREAAVDATVDAVLAEKQREDAIRRRVRAFARWTWADAWARAPLRARLLECGLPVIHRPTRLVAGE